MMIYIEREKETTIYLERESCVLELKRREKKMGKKILVSSSYILSSSTLLILMMCCYVISLMRFFFFMVWYGSVWGGIRYFVRDQENWVVVRAADLFLKQLHPK